MIKNLIWIFGKPISAAEKLRASFTNGFVKTAGKEAKTFERYLEAQLNVLNALSKQIAFLMSINGRYKWDSQVSTIVFARDDDLQAYNKYANDVASAFAALERTQAEINALAQLRSPRFR